ncbi:hypothetical protein [Paenibacillus sp. YYML68]|uniref:hypothetical protein n=1 Tax=Paenibacillus sp. YYML68 TaxID=2909250 RepID=UPI002491600E|nr:hypothetical protein [Paenibacillus sp. YYML68]
MSSLPEENVILFPKTVEYYQYELTKLLENERYDEAMKLLRFLLGFRMDDVTAREEWQSLLDWLQLMFPEGSLGDEALGARSEIEDVTESELLREHLELTGKQSEAYANRLLDAVRTGSEAGKVLLALEQLAFIEHPPISDELRAWLEEQPLHPLLQFKTLQTLRRRGCTGSITVPRHDEQLVLDIEDTPPDYERFPSQIQEIVVRVQQISEMKHPALAYFAAETWNEFLAYIYGTSTYRQMLRQEPECVDVWAAALHLTLLERVFEGGDKAELLELYGVTDELTFQWEQAYRMMQQFASAVFTRSK